MFNWNAQARGTGFPIHPQQIMQFPGVQAQFQPQIPFQGQFPQQSWAQQQGNLQGLQAMGLMMGQSWPHSTPGMFPHPGFSHDPMGGIMAGVNPVPPTLPPPEEKPPLPAEPPPPLPGGPSEKPQPPLPPQEPPKPAPPGKTKSKWDQPNKETSQNTQYAQGNNQFRGPPYPNSNASGLLGHGQPPPPHFPPPAPPPEPDEPSSPEKAPPDPALLAELERVNQEQVLFLEQHKQWKQQYDDWREQNQNHPNKDQFTQYLKQWQTYEQQMEARRASIEQQKKAVEEKLSFSSAPQVTDNKTERNWQTPEQSKVGKSRWDSGITQGDNRGGNQGLNVDKGNTPPARINEQGGFDSRPLVSGPESNFQNRSGNINSQNLPGRPNQMGPGDARGKGPSPAHQPNRGPGAGEGDKGEEDMNLDEEEDDGGGGIIESGEALPNKAWHGEAPQNQGPWNSNPGDWNSWEQGADQQGGPPQWGPLAGSDIQRGPLRGFFNQRGAPRGFQAPPENFRGRGRGDWSNPRGGPGQRFGQGGPGMKEGPLYQGPGMNESPLFGPGMNEGPLYPGDEHNEEDKVQDYAGGDDYDGGFDFDNEGSFPNTQFDNPGGRGGFNRGRGQFYRGGGDFQAGRGDFQRGRGDFQRGRGDFQRGRGDFQRGRGDFQRGRGGDFQRGMAIDFQRGRGVDYHRGRGGEFQMGRGGEFQMGRGGEFGNEIGDVPMGRGADFQRGMGNEFERGRGGEFLRGRGDFQRGRGDFQRGRGVNYPRGRGGMFSEGLPSSEFSELDDVPPRGRGGFPLRGRGRGQPPSLFDVSFDEKMKGKFADFEQLEEPGYEDENGDAAGYPRDDMGFVESTRGRGRGAVRGRGRGYQEFSGPEDFNEYPEFENESKFAQRGRGLIRGRGAIDGGRGGEQRMGLFRPMGGGFDSDPNVRDDMPEDFRFGPRGPGGVGIRGRGGANGRGGHDGFSEQQLVEGDYEGQYEEGFMPRGRGRGAMRGGRGGFVESDLDTYDGLNDAFNTEEAVVARGRGVRGAGISFGRGRGRGMNRTGFDSWDNEQEDNTVIEGQDQSLDLIEAAKPSAGLERPRGAARIPDEDEPDAKRAKFATAPGIDNDDRIGKKPYLPYPRDPYGDPYGDPYLRYDPYYRDPYLDPPLAKYGYDRLGYDRFAGLPSRFDPLLERKPFVPAESIDYGHGGVDKEKKSYQPAEVIDYGHGQSSEPKSSDAPRLALDRDRATLDTARGYSDTLRGRSDWPVEKEYSAKDWGESDTSKGARDMDLRNRDVDRSLRGQGHDSSSQSFGGRPGGYRLLEETDEDMRLESLGRGDIKGDLDYSYNRSKDRITSDQEEMYIGRRSSRYMDEDRRGELSSDLESTYKSRSDDLPMTRSEDRQRYSKLDEPYGSRGGDLYGSRREDSYSSRNLEYSRTGGDDDVRGGRGGDLLSDRFADSGLTARDIYSRDAYGRDEKDLFRGESPAHLHVHRDRFARGQSPAPPSPSRATNTVTSAATSETVKIEDLLCPPVRESRPPQIVTIIRGLPGSGKTYVSKLIREKETSYGGSAPRMLCLDDYFMVETDKEVIDPDTGKKVKKKVMEYEYEQALEEAYRQSLLKSFKKTVDDGFFPFIILDATNEKVAHFSEFWSYAKSKGFQVYVGEIKTDISTCIQRNIHNWTEWDIEKVKNNWEPLPSHYIQLDLRWILQEDSIPEVVMEDTEPENKDAEKKEEEEEEEEQPVGGIYEKSKWELDTSEETLDKLDGIRVSKKHIQEHQSLNEYLQLDQMDDEYISRESLPGKKRVRWADLEEKKTQSRRRDLGFIVGQTQQDWERITDDDFASKALNQTKYFYKS